MCTLVEVLVGRFSSSGALILGLQGMGPRPVLL